MIFPFVTFLLGSTAVRASPALVARDDVTTPLSASQVSSYAPYAYYAATAHCPLESIVSWDCSTCKKNPGFKVVATGGNGDSIRDWFVGYDPSLKTVIVAHEGLNGTQLKPAFTDAHITRGQLKEDLFPGMSKHITVHEGFRDAQEKTAFDILNGVKKAISTYQADSVTLVGNSMGAAIALLDSVYLPLHLPTIKYQSVLFGLLRVGNKDFADYVDVNTHTTRINNKKDIFPTRPPTHFGYQHPSGEVHITEDGQWISCSGQENGSEECTDGDVHNIFAGNEQDGIGPYNGIMMTCDSVS